jgi:hypothetical protein
MVLPNIPKSIDEKRTVYLKSKKYQQGIPPGKKYISL